MPGEENLNNGESEENGADGEVAQQLSTLQSKTAAQEAELKSLKEAKTDLEQRLDEADKELLSEDYLSFKETKGKSVKVTTTDGDGIDLDRASNREIVDFIRKEYKGNVEGFVKDIRKELDLSKQQLGIVVAQFDVALTSLKHDGRDGKPDWTSNEKAIFEIAKANPKWNAEKCYQQFLLQSKADADSKAEAERKRAEEEEKAATEKAGVPNSTANGKSLTKEEAASIAYKKAFGNKKDE